MNYPFIVISLCLLSLSALFTLYKQFQMLQQNSYFASRYFKWVRNSFAVGTVIETLVFFFAALLFSMSLFTYLLWFSVIVLAARVTVFILTRKRSIKPLVFTGRIKRLFGAAVIIMLGVLLGFILNKETLGGEICYTLLLMFSAVSPALCFFCWLVCLPIEKAFCAYYINDAKKILRGMPDLTVIGITGSYGKTTTKFILNRILREKYNTVCTPASFNTTMGVVRTIREKLKPQTQMFICEMGAKNKGDIEEICDIVDPRYAIITSVGAQHLETFKTVDRVFEAKFELCDSVQKNGGVCLCNTDSPGIKERIERKPFATPIGENTAFYASDIKTTPSGSSFVLHIKGETIPLKTKLLGRHSIADITAAAALAHILGVGDTDIKAAVASLTPTEHRLEMKPYFNGSVLIDDAYNSNPEGCIEALRVLGSFEGMRKTVITPGLIELGSKEFEANYNLGVACAENADDIILVGRNYTKPVAYAVYESGFDQERLHSAGSFKEALNIYLQYADKNCVLLIENDLPDNYLN